MANSSIAVTASEGRMSLLNSFQIGNGGSGRNEIYPQQVDTLVAGGFADRITISDASRTGQTGIYTGSIMVDMEYSQTAVQGTRNQFGVGVGSNFSDASAASQNVFYDNGGRNTYAYPGFGPVDARSFLNEIVTFSVPFTFGQELGMAVWIRFYNGTTSTRLACARSHDASNTVN